jgi:hypothetical protein
MTLYSGERKRMVARRTMRARPGWIGLALAGLTLAACDGDRMTVGTPPAPVEVPDARIEPGDTWTGYVESFHFASGSDRVTLAFSSPTSGTLLFGEASPNPPDPAAYSMWARKVLVGEIPPDVIGTPNGTEVINYGNELSAYPEGEAIRLVARFYEGFHFTLRDAAFDGARLAFRISLHEAWSTWCSSRPPHCDGVVRLGEPVDKPCGCTGRSDPAYDTYEAVCYGLSSTGPALRVCQCSPARCEVDLRDPTNFSVDLFHLRFDLRIRGQEMTGTSEIGEILVEKTRAGR